MKIDFTKMHGLGNDFIVIDGIRQRVALQRDDIVRLADRRLGIGCDQLLLVEKPIGPDADFRYRIFNADGTEVEQCGNGARCFVRFVFDSGLTDKRRIRVETAKGIIVPQLEDDGTVSVDMGIPLFAAADIPLTADTAASTIDFPLPVAGGIVRVDLVSMGNPHAVQQVDNVDEAPVARLGPLISSHPFFPQGINAGFMQIRDRGHIDLRVFERGAGETPACGSGACAAVVAGIRHGLLDDTVEVQTRGGILTIRWNGPGHPVEMNGPVCTVYSGTVQLDLLQTQLINNIRAEQPRC